MKIVYLPFVILVILFFDRTKGYAQAVSSHIEAGVDTLLAHIRNQSITPDEIDTPHAELTKSTLSSLKEFTGPDIHVQLINAYPLDTNFYSVQLSFIKQDSLLALFELVEHTNDPDGQTRFGLPLI
jgi:hypothetical protein